MRIAQTAMMATALLASGSVAGAAEVRVLSVGSTQVGAKALAADFTKATGHTVNFTIRPPFNIDEEFGKGTFDVLILSVPAMDGYDKAGNLAPNGRMPLARVGVGVVVKEGAPKPDVSTPDKLKAAILAARSITHGDPKLPNTSGAIAAAAIDKLGIAEQVKPKLKIAGLGPGGEMVAKGEIEMGFYNLSEIPKGNAVAGPLPAPLQGYTAYDAAMTAKGSKDAAASAFVKFLADGGAAWQAVHLEPASGYIGKPTQ
jgi:molybdate transport system substrate-binding protein